MIGGFFYARVAATALTVDDVVMDRWFSFTFVALLVAATLVATIGFSGVGPIDPFSQSGPAAWNPVIALIARAFTLPISTPGIADVRDWMLPSAFAGVLLLVSATAFRKRQGIAETWPAFPAERWLRICGAGIAMLCIASTTVNHSLELSQGWIIRYFAGVGLAIIIARAFPISQTNTALAAILTLGALSLLLSIAHRADRGLAHFTWPIGPITITAAMAALWAAMTAGLLVGRRRIDFIAFLLLLNLGVCLYALNATGRRSAAIGFIASIAFLSGALALEKARIRMIVITSIIGISLGVMGVLAYFNNQMHSADVEASGPAIVRLDYWRESATMIRESPLLGIGPDRFAIEMTRRMAPRRAVSPHRYAGNFDLYAHNEWIQATAELGLPAGVLYLALPIGVILFLWRASRYNPVHRASSLCIAAGLISIFVNEIASINLRCPVLPIWYWVLLGLGAAGCKVPASTISQSPRPFSSLPTILGISVAGIFLVIVGIDVLAATAEARGDYGPDGRAMTRLYAEKTIVARLGGAAQMEARSRRNSNPKEASETLVLWRELFDVAPSYPAVAVSFARALIESGDQSMASTLLHNLLGPNGNPYDADANILQADLSPTSPIEQLRCVQRALRNGALNQDLCRVLDRIVSNADVKQIVHHERSLAMAIARQRHMEDMRGCDLEMLRINAYFQSHGGDVSQAIADQRAVADCYRSLEETNHPYRRFYPAEIDAPLTLSHMLYDSDKSAYQEAYQAALQAERSAVLSIHHEKVAHRQPQLGFVMGEVVPTEAPAHLRPLWQWSALMHLAAGKFDLTAGEYPFLDLRIYLSLPREKWTPEAVDRERARMAAKICHDFSSIPASRRPARYSEVCQMAKSAAP